MRKIVLGLAGRAAAAPLRLAPFSLQQAALERVLNGLFQRSIGAGELDFLEGRSLVLEIADLGWRWPLTLRHGRIRIARRAARADATVHGRAATFLTMARGLEDPDTLFFQRRLAIEGDTELGLALKNFLDGLDPADLALPAPVGAARALCRRVLPERATLERAGR